MSASPRIVARTELLIRCTPAQVYRGFVEPDMLTKFWLSAASGPLELGATVHWSFMVEGAEVDTRTTALDVAKRIAWEWPDGTSVEVRIEPFRDDPGASHVTIEHVGFDGDLDDLIAAAVDSTQGFTLVLSNLKLLLETGTAGNLVSDNAALIMASMREANGA
jgi:uncharacterized protein YndB with AHSA1/START domain